MEKERAGLLQNMRQSLEKVDLQALRCYTKRVAELGIDPVVAIRYGLMDGMCALSEAFDEGEILSQEAQSSEIFTSYAIFADTLMSKVVIIPGREIPVPVP